MRRRKSGSALAVLIGAASLTLVGLQLPGTATHADDDSHWFVSFDSVNLAPTARSDTTQLLEIGSIDTDGFSDLVFSLGGEFKEGVPTSGRVGVVLIPDHLLGIGVVEVPAGIPLAKPVWATPRSGWGSTMMTRCA